MVKDNLMTTTDNQSARIGPSVRLSGVELLKLFAILMIVVFHVIQTLVWKSEFIANEEYIISIHTATTDVMRIILTLLCYLGSIGNAIFFVCSAWFLLDSKRVNTKKMLFMELEIWLFSVAVLIASYLIRGSDISKTLILRSLFPTSCQNN